MPLQKRVPEKFPLVSMGGRVEGLGCADPGVRTPIGASENLNIFIVQNMTSILLEDIVTMIVCM